MSDSIDLVPALVVDDRAGHALEVPIIPTGDPPVPTDQRIFDSNLNAWCWYSLVAITATPNVGDTTPNHTNNLVAATHEVMS